MPLHPTKGGAFGIRLLVRDAGFNEIAALAMPTAFNIRQSKIAGQVSRETAGSRPIDQASCYLRGICLSRKKGGKIAVPEGSINGRRSALRLLTKSGGRYTSELLASRCPA